MIDTLTPKQEQALAELRRLIESEVPPEVEKDTTLLCKFLQARNYNVNQAESMLKKSLRWRKEVQTDMILTDFEPPEVILKYVSVVFLGFSKEGYPIRYIAIGNTDGKGLFKSTNSWNVMKFVLQVIEGDINLHKLQSEKLGRKISHSINIYDMENFTLAKATHKPSIQLFLKGIGIFQDNYPEYLHKVFVINASVYFTYVWPLIQAILSSHLVNKIHVYGKEGWKKDLLEEIDADVLPAFLGGKRTDPDGNPRCISFVNPAGTIPESYYIEKDIQKMAKKPGTKCASIERLHTFRDLIYIHNPGFIIHWEFEVKHHDIAFGIALETSVDGHIHVEEVIPVHRRDTEVEPDTGKYICKRAGNYYVVFDNSYSWFSKKEVYYRTWVTNAEGVVIQ